MHFHRGVKGGYAELRGVFLEHLRCREATEVAIAEGWLKSILALIFNQIFLEPELQPPQVASSLKLKTPRNSAYPPFTPR